MVKYHKIILNMQDIIHLSIKEEHFHVPKSILEKSKYLNRLLEIQSNDIELLNIDPFIFKLIIKLLENTIDIQAETAKVYDFLEIDEKNNFIHDFYCDISDCNNITLEKPFCTLHKCCVCDCKKRKRTGKNHCMEHSCKKPSCPEIAVNKTFCESHKCKVDDCNLENSYVGSNFSIYCRKHTCKIDGCNMVAVKCEGFSILCEEHITHSFLCEVDKCENESINGTYCINHKCKYCDKQVIQIEGIDISYCEIHTCQGINCNNPVYCKENQRGYCRIHTCVRYGCTNFSYYPDELCYWHKYQKN